jgi:hypothetical protein
MLDERIGHNWRPNMAKSVVVSRTIARSPVQQEAIVADTIYFLLAVAAVSAAIFALSMRADRGRRGSSDGGSYDPGVSSTTDSSVASWFGSNHFGPSTDMFGSGDSGGWSGGDSGGSDAGGGGGSSD